MTDLASIIIEVPVKVEGLPRKIWEARKLSGRTQVALCKEAGITRQYWSQIEKGQHPSMPLHTLRNIERVLGADFGIQG
jgi:transcriptional regulator with XRE-family HTH domain